MGLSTALTAAEVFPADPAAAFAALEAALVRPRLSAASRIEAYFIVSLYSLCVRA